MFSFLTSMALQPLSLNNLLFGPYLQKHTGFYSIIKYLYCMAGILLKGKIYTCINSMWFSQKPRRLNACVSFLRWEHWGTVLGASWGLVFQVSTVKEFAFHSSHLEWLLPDKLSVSSWLHPTSCLGKMQNWPQDRELQMGSQRLGVWTELKATELPKHLFFRCIIPQCLPFV